MDIERKGPSTRAAWRQGMSSEQLIKNPSLLAIFTQLTPVQEQKYSLDQAKIEALLLLDTLLEEPCGDIMGTRARFGEMIKHWEGVDIDCRNTSTIGPLKPDVLHRKLGRTGELSIRVVGEVIKMEGRGDFSHEDQGQILDFLQTTLMVQPWRSFIYGYLTDCKRFEFFCAKRVKSNDGTSITFEQSGVLYGDNGWKALRLMVAQDDVALGFTDVYIEGWAIETLLGTGLTSAVFRVKSMQSDMDAVCKLFFDVNSGSQLRQNELTMLGKLSQFDCIPKVVVGAPAKSACGRSVLIKMPLGLDLPKAVCLPISAYAHIIEALKYAHSNDVFHNDIAPQNLLGITLANKSMIALLNDFGSACGIDTIKKESSTIASRPLFYTKHQGFGPEADLCAFVRSIFFLTQLTFIPADVKNAEQLDEIINHQIWFWKDALRLAQLVDYDGLYDHLLKGGKTSIEHHN